MGMLLTVIYRPVFGFSCNCAARRKVITRNGCTLLAASGAKAKSFLWFGRNWDVTIAIDHH